MVLAELIIAQFQFIEVLDVDEYPQATFGKTVSDKAGFQLRDGDTQVFGEYALEMCPLFSWRRRVWSLGLVWAVPLVWNSSMTHGAPSKSKTMWRLNSDGRTVCIVNFA